MSLLIYHIVGNVLSFFLPSPLNFFFFLQTCFDMLSSFIFPFFHSSHTIFNTFPFLTHTHTFIFPFSFSLFSCLLFNNNSGPAKPKHTPYIREFGNVILEIFTVGGKNYAGALWKWEKPGWGSGEMHLVLQVYGFMCYLCILQVAWSLINFALWGHGVNHVTIEFWSRIGIIKV